MNIREKLFHSIVLTALFAWVPALSAHAQLDFTQDTLSCPIIGFNVGPVMPSTKFSTVTLPDGSTNKNATMASLYKAPYLDFGLNALYKTKSNWLAGIEGNIWFGGDNLNHRVERMGSVFSRDSIVIGTNGTDANVTCYNRGLSVQAGFGKIFPLVPSNPNSGILARLSGGYMLQQSIFMINDVNAPQIDGDYALLYDHQRSGFVLTEALGYWFMSNRANLVNFYVAFEVQQCWTKSTRDYTIDDYLGLRGKDNNRYFDLVYTVKFCWMFPLKGKSSHDYYFY